MKPSQHLLKTPLALLTVLGIGALCGWLLDGRAPVPAVLAIATVAIASVWMGSRPPSVIPVAQPASVAARSGPFMTHSRRLASGLRDLRLAARDLPDAVVLLDHELRVRWFNRAAGTLLGLHRPHDRGVILDERLPIAGLAAWLRDGTSEPLSNAPAPGQPEHSLHITQIPFGRHRLLLARDISHLSRLEQVRRDFVANVSHELRTPLTVIHGYLELIDESDVPELAPVLGEMRTQSRRMGQIVEDLLVLSRLETQDQIVEERVRMAPMLATLGKEAEALSQGRHRIVLAIETGSDLLGSAKDLHSALSNLVSNAVRYTPAGGTITIRWRATADGAAYSVGDTGYGIAAGHLARLTERFYRVSSSRSRESGGTGLGLSIVKHVLNLHHARLAIESTPGQGSTFTCHFDARHLLDPDPGEDCDGRA